MTRIAAIILQILIVIPLNSIAGDLASGKKLARKCSVCHGRDGISRDPEDPHLAGMSKLYFIKPMEACQSGQRQTRRMTIIAKPLSEADIEDLAEWFSQHTITVTAPE